MGEARERCRASVLRLPRLLLLSNSHRALVGFVADFVLCDDDSFCPNVMNLSFIVGSRGGLRAAGVHRLWLQMKTKCASALTDGDRP